MSSFQKAGAALAAVLLLVIVVVVATRGSDGSSAATDSTSSTSSSTTEASAGASTSTSGAVVDPGTPPTTLATGDEVGTTGPTNTDGNSIMVPIRSLPLDVEIDDKNGLSDGDTVTVHVSAKSGSKIYGADARLCRADAVIDNTADFAPTQGGQCVAAPLSSGSDAYVEQAATDPFSSLDLPFRVGTGTSTYQVQDGSSASITCGSGHPCTLVVRLQVPNGFGFQSFDLSFG